MSPRDEWLEAMWTFVASQLPGTGLDVIDMGCGESGGFVPMLIRDGHRAVGIDPEAPPGRDYRQFEFERYEPRSPVDVVVASTSLHHVADVTEVVAHLTTVLKSGGTLIVIEWAAERFDERTARWCFDRLPMATSEEKHGWLQHRRDEWLASGQSWERYLSAWRREQGLHSGEDILHALDSRFERRLCTYRPYLFADLPGTTRADEQAAIDAGEIQATCIEYIARRC